MIAETNDVKRYVVKNFEPKHRLSRGGRLACVAIGLWLATIAGAGAGAARVWWRAHGCSVSCEAPRI